MGRAAGGQPPDPRDLSLLAINSFCRMCWLALSERKQEWLPKAATVPGGARHSWVQRTCRRHLSDARVASQQTPVLLRDTGGYVRVRRLSRGFSRRRRTNALAPDRPVTAFDPATALRMEWACADVRHPGNRSRPCSSRISISFSPIRGAMSHATTSREKPSMTVAMNTKSMFVVESLQADAHSRLKGPHWLFLAARAPAAAPQRSEP